MGRRRRIWKNKKREPFQGSVCDLCSRYERCWHDAHNKSQESWVSHLTHMTVSEMWLRGVEVPALKYFYSVPPATKE